jgi:thymidylate synthase (FAD)
MSKEVTILYGDPVILPIAEMRLNALQLEGMAEWVKEHRPECLPDEYQSWRDLFPHKLADETVATNPEALAQEVRGLTDVELLVELAGRACYHSFGLKAGKRSNAEYIANTQSMDPPHASILYHAKMTFFFAGISRRVSHELIRNYVGADRNEEGNPSQESTRFTHHYGFFICPPKYMRDDFDYSKGHHQQFMQERFKRAMQMSYDHYLGAVEEECAAFQQKHGKQPSQLDRKRIYEAASSFLPHQAETSFIWSTNVAAIAKLVKERADNAADLEIQRFAKKLRKICVERWPNVFPQAHMQRVD